MTEKKHITPQSISQKNYTLPTEKRNFVPQTEPGVQGNHIPTTNERPSTPPPSPKKK